MWKLNMIEIALFYMPNVFGTYYLTRSLLKGLCGHHFASAKMIFTKMWLLRIRDFMENYTPLETQELRVRHNTRGALLHNYLSLLNMVVLKRTHCVFSCYSRQLFKPWQPSQTSWAGGQPGCWAGHLPGQWSLRRGACSALRDCGWPAAGGGG